MKSKVIKEKREELISFVKKQMQGPGALNGRFGIDDWDKGEVLDETPGSIYSTAIMFPAKDSSAILEDDANNNNDAVENDTVDNTTNDNDTQNEEDSNTVEGSDVNDDDSKELCQRFPQSYGISFCLDENIINDNDLKVVIRARHYSKEQDFPRTYVNVAQEDCAGVIELANSEILQRYFNYKKTDDGQGKLYIKSDSKKDYRTIKALLDEINKSKYRSLSEWEEQMRHKDMFLASYKHHLYHEILMNTSETVTQERRERASTCIKDVETSERTLSYFNDILKILDRNGYGFWKAENLEHQIDLSEISLNLPDGQYRKIYTPSECDALKNIIKIPFSTKLKGSRTDSGDASVSAWIQVVKNSRNRDNNKIYVKVLVENTSDKMKEEKGNLFSIVNESVNIRSFFGIEVEATSSHIVPYQDICGLTSEDKELEQLNYVYRNVKSYGIGHVCSVEWDRLDNNRMKVSSSFTPSVNVPDVDVSPKRFDPMANTIEEWIPDTKYLGFKVLSTLSEEPDNAIKTGLNDFAYAYGKWIDTQTDSNQMASNIQEACKIDYKRIVNNIALLDDATNMRAFRMMNTAMFLQLWHSRKENLEQLNTDHRTLRRLPNEDIGRTQVTEDYYKNLDGTVDGQRIATWRSFQLAFILLNLDGIIQDEVNDPDWAKRNELVDLVWFPTGGGKTEAYLGLIALSIITRRFRAANGLEDGGGTTAIMRYTLRLLATQQFQRAMRLILALGAIKRWSVELGDEPISIGLYVGNDSLPNTSADLDREAEKWNNDSPSKIPLDKNHCPWCGGALEYNANDHIFRCTSGHCPFNSGLPIYLCDEMVYQNPPTLLFGTVDKFAMIAHKVSTENNKDSRRLFRYNGNTPDLIIQDELHLLCGPLGSAVGLFECAIEQLATKEKNVNDRTIKVKPKVISSTATTRNTEMQIRALYRRDVNVFPKSGIRNDDSFFASYKRDANNPAEFCSKRKYVGILPTGRTGMYTQLRLASCILAHRAVYEYEHDKDFNGQHKEDFLAAADYYYTMISYFNSKKDVGTTDSQFASEFPKYTRQIFNRVLRPDSMLHCHYTYNEGFEKSELTGRLNGEEVVSNLAKVQEHWDINHRDTWIKPDGNAVKGSNPPDVVLATNMISVGIDVSRFSVMIVNSMPKNKAEYIQATSRVARDESGVVFTIHNPFRARDVSHFEQFREFHEKLYYYVEPISITPFSRKSIETFMPLYLAAVIRHSYPDLAIDSDARKITQEMVNSIKNSSNEYFQKLAADKTRFSEIIDDKALSMIKEFIGKALAEWLAKKDQLTRFSTMEYDRKALFVPIDAYEDERFNTTWLVPTSVRFIPTESVLHVQNER